jgi:tripartite-type tricarboxylate transporter receptor subunit TctC
MRRPGLAAFLLLAAAVAVPGAHAQSYPARPIKFLVPAGPGSAPDLRARQIGAKLSDAFGQPVVIENRPGGNYIIAAEIAARAPADGYTLFLGNSVTHSTNPVLFKSLPYRADEDFVPVTLVTAAPFIVVINAKVPASSFAELLDLARKQPGKLAYASSGLGSPSHVLMEQIKLAAGVDLAHVPYKATGAEIPDLIAGHIAVGFNFWSILAAHVRSDKLKPLAVAGPRRLAAAPQVPTLAEVGLPGIEMSAWQGIFVPAATPKPIVDRLYAEVARILRSPELHDQIVDTGTEVGGNTPEEFAEFVRVDRARMKRAIEQAGISAQ